MSELFLRLMNPDPRKAEQAYERQKRRLIFYFQHNNLGPEAEDLAQETISRVAKKLLEMGPAAVNDRTDEDLIKFTFGVARIVAKEGRRLPKWGAGTEGFPESVESDERFSSRKPDPEANFRAKEKWGLVQACLQVL